MIKKITILGHDFFVDSTSMALVLEKDMQHIITTDEMNSWSNTTGKECVHYYQFTIDTTTGIPVCHGQEKENQQCEMVSIEHFVKLDSAGMRQRFSLQADEQLPARDELFPNQRILIQERAQGVLPNVHVRQWTFLVNGQKGFMINKRTGTSEKVQLIGFHQMVQVSNYYRFFFNREQGLVLLDQDSKGWVPEQIDIVQIPHPTVIDPYGVSQAEGVETYLHLHPVRRHFDATVIAAPLSGDPDTSIRSCNLYRDLFNEMQGEKKQEPAKKITRKLN